MRQTTIIQIKSKSESKNTFFVQFSSFLKFSIFIIFSLFLADSSQAQDNTEFKRDGRWLVETGYNIVSGITGGGTGVNLLVDSDGESITSIGAEIGKFTSENFALKLRLGIISSGGFNITNFGIGGKYYIGGNVPIDFGVGVISGSGNSQFLGNLGIGYAINVASNITFEPSLGGIFSDDSILINFKIGFAMFL